MLVEVENVLFANSLIGTTIQDGGKREKNNDNHMWYYANIEF